MMEFFSLLFKTILLRPYVFVFLAAGLFVANRLIGWRRAGLFFGITWAVAFLCEFSSTRTGIPFGLYHFNGSTIGQELYLSNIPFITSMSFSFLLYTSYSLALFLLLPKQEPYGTADRRLNFDLTLDARTSWPVFGLGVLLFVLLDVVIDPVALRGDRWFLGKIYDYAYPGEHFGVPVSNYVGWAVVGAVSLAIYFPLDRRSPPLRVPDARSVTANLLLGCGLYYGVLAFNLAVTFWIGELWLGMTGLLLYLPVTALLTLRLHDRAPAPSPHSEKPQPYA
jgi:putative membrane protein